MNNLKKLGYRPDVIIDVGAYQGAWTVQANEIFKNSKYLMIEAQASKEKYLKELVDVNINIDYKICLLGKEYNPKQVFYELETGSSVYYEQTDFKRNIVHYEMNTLDAVVNEKKLEGEFFIKLDVQGAEIDILEGAKDTLGKTNFILLETSLLNYNLGAPLIADIIEYLNEKQFVLFDICDQLRKDDGVLFQVDLIFSRKDSSIRKEVNFKLD
jgi:FkbM family methyltransferase